MRLFEKKIIPKQKCYPHMGQIKDLKCVSAEWVSRKKVVSNLGKRGRQKDVRYQE